jgi:hypothetical protein
MGVERGVLLKRSVIAVLVVLVGMLAPSAVAQTPTQDSVTGTARDCLQPLVDNECVPSRPISVELDAHSGPSGENPSGTAEMSAVFGSNAFIDVQGPVSCLAVSGKTAIIGYTSAPDERTLMRVVDGGSSPGQDSFEVVLQFAPSGTVEPAPDCSVFPPPAQPGSFSPAGVNLLGDLVVTDAQQPTTSAQCRQAGWVKYGYASHAQCIDGVHQFPRQKCIFERAGIGITAFRSKYGLGANHDHAMRHCVRLYTGF